MHHHKWTTIASVGPDHRVTERVDICSVCGLPRHGSADEGRRDLMPIYQHEVARYSAQINASKGI